MFRPWNNRAFVTYGAKSRTAVYRVFYTPTQPLLTFLHAAFPNRVLTTEQIGRAMLAVARQGFPSEVASHRIPVLLAAPFTPQPWPAETTSDLSKLIRWMAADNPTWELPGSTVRS